MLKTQFQEFKNYVKVSQQAARPRVELVFPVKQAEDNILQTREILADDELAYSRGTAYHKLVTNIFSFNLTTQAEIDAKGHEAAWWAGFDDASEEQLLGDV